MVPNKSDFSAEEFLQIVTHNISGSVTLKRELERYLLNKTEDLSEKCSKLELENQSLKDKNAELKQRLAKYESTQPICETTNSQQILEQLTQRVSSTVNEIVVQINRNRTVWDEELLKYYQDYEHCKAELQRINLKPMSDAFDKKLKEYKKICEKNDLSRKETLKMLYEIDKISREKQAQENERSSKCLKEIESFVKGENDKLNKIKEVIMTYELNKERKLYEDALHLGKQETALFSNLLANSENNNKSKTVVPTLKASPKANTKVQRSSDERSIVVLNFPSDGLPEVLLHFLNNFSNGLDLKKENVEITKTFNGRTFINLTKVTLPSAELVNKVLKGENTIKTDYKGISICIYSYKDHQNI